MRYRYRRVAHQSHAVPVSPVRFNHLPLGSLSLVILLDSKAQQTELEWISYPPNGVSPQNAPYLAIVSSSSLLCGVPHL